MLRAFQLSLLAALGLATALSACSAGPLSDRLPESMGGLPAGAPARPVTPYQYPAVHDMPPARESAPLSEGDQDKLEKELRAARDRQEAQEGQGGKASQKGQAATKAATVTKKTAVSATKKQPADVIVVPPAGVKTNP
jgi:hypothetical protein